jgi:hypothetical protein
MVIGVPLLRGISGTLLHAPIDYRLPLQTR